MIKPKKEDYNFKDNKFNSVNDSCRYKVASRKYLSWKRSDNKGKLIRQITSMLLEDPDNFELSIESLLIEALEKYSQKDLKNWL